MDKAKPFDDYFTDEKLSAEKRARLKLLRQLIHAHYPEVKERVSYAMPGFYPADATKANQRSFLFMANKNWLGIYGTQGLMPADFADFDKLSFGKGSIQVPYDYPENELTQLIKLVIDHNLKRHQG